jgi:hypothetical protein
MLLDLHAESTTQTTLANGNAAFTSKFLTFQESMARYFAKYDPNNFFFETLNEPVFLTAQAFSPFLSQMIAAIRRGAPLHTIVAGANLRVTENDYNGIAALRTIVPDASDTNIVYNFHYYDPFLFSHQGATWGWDPVRYIHDLPFPSTPDNISPLLPSYNDTTIRGYVWYYGEQRWNATFIASLLKPVYDWANQYKVLVTCNEFGAYKIAVAPADRNRYIAAVRSVFELYNIGWSMWEAIDGFGLFTSTIDSTNSNAPAWSTGKRLDVGTYAALFTHTSAETLNHSLTSHENSRLYARNITTRTRRVFTHYLPWYDTAQRSGWCGVGDCSDIRVKQYTAAPLIGEYSQVHSVPLDVWQRMHGTCDRSENHVILLTFACIA